MEDVKYYTLKVDEVIQRLQTDRDKGLTHEEAKNRLQKFGRNLVEDKDKKSALRTLLEQFENPIVWILIIATGLAFAYQHTLEGIAVSLVILINVMIGFMMERQAIQSMEKLRSMARAKTFVQRSGNKIEIDSLDLVPGDIIHLKAGDVVTADARIVSGNDLALKEAALTGESTQIEKNIIPIPDNTKIADRKNSVFKGTVVSRGHALAVVVATGKNTELGRITEMTEGARKEATPLNKKLKVLSRKLIWLTLILAVIIFLSGIARGVELTLMIETAIALAIASIPEGLPVISTLSLARGMLGLAKKNVIVKTLEAVETLGETEVIFTDKTGTITENEMRVHAVAFDGVVENISREKKEELRKLAEFDTFLKVGVLCNTSTFEIKENKVTSTGDPEEVALLRMAADLGEDVNEIRKKHDKVEEHPFDSEIKMMGTVNQSGDEFMVCVKGATEETIQKFKSV
jgi:P-type Ca2+ transporter type 2C